MLDSIFSCNPLPRIYFQAWINQILHVLIVFPPVSIPIGYWARPVSIILQFSGLVRGTHFIQHHSKGPHIYFRTHQNIFLANFWRNVAPCSTSLHHHCFPIVFLFHKMRKAKITNLCNGVLIFIFGPVEKSILNFHVTMDDSQRVNISQPFQNVETIFLQFFLVHYRRQFFFYFSFN